MMRRMMGLSVVAGAFGMLLAQVSQAQALTVAIAPILSPTQQAMSAEIIVVGKVIEIEKEPTKATPAVGVADKVDYTIAVIKIAENLKGANGLTTIRVGFQAAAQNNAAPELPRAKLRPAIGRVAPTVTLAQDQEGCFFLSKHHDGDFYVMMQRSRPLDKQADGFDKQLGSIKKLMKVLEDPKAALKAKEASDRQFAACMLVQKYRSYPQINVANAQVVQESIDADESKLILKALAEMTWGQVDPNGTSLQNTFYLLGLQPKDGWAQPKIVQGQDFNKVMGDEVVKWLNANADKYRIQRQVVAIK